MGRIWSEENRFRNWLAVEVAATETLAEAGIVPTEAAEAIRKRANFRVERIHEIEAEVKHDVIAFTTSVAEFVGPDSRWCHYGLTSNDVVDSAQALLIAQASKIIAADLERLAEVLKRRAWEFKNTPMVGRTEYTLSRSRSDSNWPIGIPKCNATSPGSSTRLKTCGSASYPAQWEHLPISRRNWKKRSARA